MNVSLPARLARLALPALLIAACGRDVPTPSDDPADYDASVDRALSYDVAASAPEWLVPSPALPRETPTMASNNNVDLQFHGGRLYLAWRTSELHFASRDTRMYVVSSDDGGRTWSHELTLALGSDVREPRFLSLRGALQLMFFQAGVEPFAFEPQLMWRTRRVAPGRWSELETFGEPGEIPWCVKVRGGRAYMTSYIGNHYEAGESRIDVRFSESDDGLVWRRVDGVDHVYRGGVSEVAFELARDGTLWAVLRNEDGDATGFGSNVCTAAPGSLGTWRCAPHAFAERYDSPAMFRHGDELYLVARRDVGGPFDLMRADLSFADQKTQNLVAYSARPKRTALYRIDRDARGVRWLFDLPGDGDTAFPALRRTGAHSWLLANYTSPLTDPDRSWIVGQTASDGTQIYSLTLTFTPKGP